MALQGCLIFRQKLADELEERQRRTIQTREKTGNQENWSGQDYSLADIYLVDKPMDVDNEGCNLFTVH